MTITLNVPETHELKPKILVIGVGGAGCNAVNNMITSHLEGVEFIVANTDAQSLAQSLTERRIQLGVNITQGLGAGAHPDVGRQSAEEALDNIQDHLTGSNMVFVTCGMGGGTGTGAAPVVARAARDAGILTVGVTTKPFDFEGRRRRDIAEAGIAELHKVVDTLIIIPNQNLFRIANDQTTLTDAFKLADEVLHSGVRGVTDLMVMPGLINLDFADVRAVMGEMGKAMMGTGEAEGEERAKNAAGAAIANPLLDDVSLKGARGVLVNITGGSDMTLYEVDEACNHIREQVDADANFIFGSTFDESLAGRFRVSVVATGIEDESERHAGEESASALDGLPEAAMQVPGAREGLGAPETQAVSRSAPAAVFHPAGSRDAEGAPRGPVPRHAPAPPAPEPSPARMEPMLTGRPDTDRIPSGEAEPRTDSGLEHVEPGAPARGKRSGFHRWMLKGGSAEDRGAPVAEEETVVADSPRADTGRRTSDGPREIPDFLRRLPS